MSLVIDDVLVRHDPAGPVVPVVFDSPHSGTRYPSDFDFVCPFSLLRQAEDSWVDELYAHVPDQGATLLCALFPRSYIDANRSESDIDPALLADPWPYPLNPTDKSGLGMGLVRHLCRPGVPMYDGRLSAIQVMDRIERYWRPYHETLAQALQQLHARFGVVWHVNCHSMPSVTSPADPVTGRRADFVLGDRDGTSCAPAFTQFVADVLRSRGYRVVVNDPYKGVELVQRYANPGQGRHSLQVEIDRRLYMNEETLERHQGFETLRRDLMLLTRRICAFAAETAIRHAAE